MSGDDVLREMADAHAVGVRQVALAWRLHHAEDILLIPGTSSADHVEQNIVSVDFALTPDTKTALGRIGSTSGT